MGIWDKHASAFDESGIIDRTGSIQELGFYKIKIGAYGFSISTDAGGQAAGRKKTNTKGWTIVKVNFEVLKTSHGQSVPVGTTRVWLRMINPNDENQSKFAMSELKQHFGAVAKRDPATITAKMIGQLEGEPRKFEGTICLLEVREGRDPKYKDYVFTSWDDKFESLIVDRDAPAGAAPSTQATTSKAADKVETKATPAKADPVEDDEPKW